MKFLVLLFFIATVLSAKLFLKEELHKFLQIYGESVGFSVRSNKMKKYVDAENLEGFYSVHKEIIKQFEYFDENTGHLPFYNEGLILLQEMV